MLNSRVLNSWDWSSASDQVGGDVNRPKYATAVTFATRPSGAEAVPSDVAATGLQPLVHDMASLELQPSVRKADSRPRRAAVGRVEAIVFVAIAVASIAGAYVGTWLALRAS